MNLRASRRRAVVHDAATPDRARARAPMRAVLALALACALSAAWAPTAAATKPAVRAVNGQLIGAYGFDRQTAVTASQGGSSVYLPETNSQGWAVGGVLTIPVVHRLGARVLGSGGITDIEGEAGSGFAGSDADAVTARAGVDLFVRDPDVGFIGLGYRFGWENPPDLGDRLLTNAVVFESGVFIPDQGLGPIDWNVEFAYGRSKLSGSGASDQANDYAVDATSGWYVTPSWRFTGGFRFRLEDPDVALPRRDMRGTAELAWLLPTGQRRFVTAAVTASGGRAREALSSPFSPVDRAVWAVGGTITVSLPGATSLLELTRELH